MINNGVKEAIPRGKAMIQVNSLHLNKSESKILRTYGKYVLSKFCAPSVQYKSTVKINVVHENDLDNYADIEDLRKYRAWCYYDGFHNDRKTFRVVLNIKQINTRAKKPLTRMRNILTDLGHELVHVKQYLNNEIFDYVSGGVRYKGSYFDYSYQQNLELYYDSPWEVEAYGRELGLYKVFVQKVKTGEISL
jgi:hypothetical protein